jgi:hypothetical protein
MAVLLDGIGPHRGGISLRVSTRTEAMLLIRTAECLAVLSTTDRFSGGYVVAVGGSRQVQRLLSEVGVGDAAYAWAKCQPGHDRL